MPSPLAHSFCGFLFYPETEKFVFINKVYAGSFIVVLSCLPDFDYFVGMVTGDLRAGHRLFSHSLFFPLLVGVVFGLVGRLLKKKFLHFFLLSASCLGVHTLLDYLTFDYYPQNGIGVALLWPFSKQFFTFPFHPFAGWVTEGPRELLFILITDLYFMAVFSGLFFIFRYQRKEKKCVSGS